MQKWVFFLYMVLFGPPLPPQPYSLHFSVDSAVSSQFSVLFGNYCKTLIWVIQSSIYLYVTVQTLPALLRMCHFSVESCETKQSSSFNCTNSIMESIVISNKKMLTSQNNTVCFFLFVFLQIAVIASSAELAHS